MKRKTAFLLLLLCLLCGCGERESREKAVTCVSAEDCFLCGRAETVPWEQNNVGLISLNTFDIMPIHINRYGDKGELVEESSGVFRLRSFQSREDGFRASAVEDPDRSYALLTVAPGEDGALDREKAAAFLCEDCLERAVPEGEKMGLGAIDFATGKVRAFEEGIRGFGLGDFYIHCDWKEGDEMELLVFYSPLRA